MKKKILFITLLSAVALSVSAAEFSVSATRKVTFAPGNLQDNAGAWQFAANQWEYIGTSDRTDLFAWRDGGYSPSIGGAPAGTWRTLTQGEWMYLLGLNEGPMRPNAANLRAIVTLTDRNVKGLVILPDGSSATASSITTADLLASSGAAFLPCAGWRNASSDVYEAGTDGTYWTATASENGESYAVALDFDQVRPDREPASGNLRMVTDCDRRNGFSVRLVRELWTPNSGELTWDASTGSYTYTRTVSSNWGTLILPFEIESGNGVQLYTASVVSATPTVGTAALSLTSCSSVAAHTPCFFYTTNTSITFTHSGAVENPPSVNPVELGGGQGWWLYGTYTGTTLATEVGANAQYFIAGNCLWLAESTVSVAPFRAYMQYAGEAAPARITLQADEATLLPAVEEGAPVVRKILRDGRVLIVRDGVVWGIDGGLMGELVNW